MISDQMLLKNMTNDGIIYAMYDKRHDRFLSPDSDMFTDSKYIEKYCVVQSPSVFENTKKGTCYETAWYVYDQLKKEKYDGVTLAFLEFANGETHTLTIYKNRFSRLWYWFEYSWESMRGIYGGYKNIEFLHKFIEDTCRKQKKKINMFNSSVDMSVFDKEKYVPMDKWNKQMKA